MHIAYACMSKFFSILAINNNNCLYRNIIVYKLDPLSYWRCDIRNYNPRTIFVFPWIDVILNLNMNNILTKLSPRVHSYPECRKRMRSTHGLTRHIHTCTSQGVLLIYMQPEQDTLILWEDDNISKNFRPHEDNKSEEQNIEADHRNLIGDSLDTENRAKDGLSRHTSQDRLFISELSASLGEVRFSE